MEKLFATLWTKYRAATIAAAAGLVVVVGVGGWLLLGNGGGSGETKTSAASAPPAPAQPAGPPLSSWPTYGFDPARTRYLPTRAVKPPYKVAWSYDCGGQAPGFSEGPAARGLESVCAAGAQDAPSIGPLKGQADDEQNNG